MYVETTGPTAVLVSYWLAAFFTRGFFHQRSANENVRKPPDKYGLRYCSLNQYLPISNSVSTAEEVCLRKSTIVWRSKKGLQYCLSAAQWVSESLLARFPACLNINWVLPVNFSQSNAFKILKIKNRL
jgi:hypothetical protein